MKKLIFTLIITGSCFYNLSFAQAPAAASADTTILGFLVQANIYSLRNIRSGFIAKRRAESKDLRKYGINVMVDNARLHKAMMKLIKQKGYTYKRPALAESTPDALFIQSRGGNFDKAYTDLMMHEDQKTISMFENVASNSPDADVKSIAQQMILKTKQRLTSIKDIASRIDISNSTLIATNE